MGEDGEVKKESKKEGGKECGVRRVLVVVRTEERGDPKAERACREVREGVGVRREGGGT